MGGGVDLEGAVDFGLGVNLCDGTISSDGVALGSEDVFNGGIILGG